MAEKDQCFESMQQWINKAPSWLTRHPNYNDYYRAICFDSTGRICRNGGDMKAAIYPVYWIWPDQNLFNMIDSVQRKEFQK